MTVGDQTDIYNRLIAQLPNWFGTSHPILDAVLQAYIGYSNNTSRITTMFFHYNFQYLYSKLQMRIQTATDINLDLISQDYLGNTLPRRTNETDDSYRKRILSNVVRPRATRSAMDSALFALTGFHPVIIEPWSGVDHGYYNQPATLAYNIYGGYGSDSYPYQAWIYVYLRSYQGMAEYPGFNLNSYAETVSIDSGGAGYAVDDIIILDSSDLEEAIELSVTSVSSGAVTGVTIAYKGIYQEPLPTNPISQSSTSGGGSGATINVDSWLAYILNMGYTSYGNGISGWYGGASQETTDVTEEDVLQLIEATKVGATLMHTTIIYVS